MGRDSSDGNRENGLSVQQVINIRAEAFATLRHLHATSQSVAREIEDVNVALQTSLAERSIDTHLALVSAARHLAEVVETAVTL